MSWNNKIVWSEGMFLQPQHFQQHDRYMEKLIRARTAPLLGHSWGFVQLELDGAALALGKIQIASARGLFPDGTPFNFPDHDAPPTPLDVPPDAKEEMVYLALPMLRPGTDEADFSAEQTASLARFSVDDVEVRDSNAAADRSALVQIGQLRLRLLRGREVTDAYTTLGVAKVTERRADNQVILQRAYIPPVLHAGAVSALAGYVQELHGLLHQRGETLAARLSQPGRGGVSEIADFILLQTINRYEPLFSHLAAHPLLHPERLFSICLELAGDMATLSHTSRRPPAFAPYQHDALEQSFLPLIDDLRRELGTAVVLITHDLGVVAEVAQRMIVMYAGRKVEEGTTQDLFASPRHPYLQGLLASVPRFGVAGTERLREIPGIVPPLNDLPPGCAFAPRCPLAIGKCRIEIPPLELKTPGHGAACWVT